MSKPLRTLGLTAVLAAIWWLLSGYTQGLILGLGAASVALCVLIAHRMDVIDDEGFPVHLGPAAVTYWPWLWLEICKSTRDTILVILKPRDHLRPVVFRAYASQSDELGRTTYANSITLTPGTVTLAMDGETFLIHALNGAMQESVLDGEMDRRVTRMMGETPPAENGAENGPENGPDSAAGADAGATPAEGGA
ncbi:MAG: Na+/H+ antiporter subunit E [Rhodospirillales bacterium]